METLPTWQSQNSLTAASLSDVFEGRGNISALERLGGVEKILKDLHTEPKNGISPSANENTWRQTTFGSNQIPERKYNTLFQLFIEALKDTTLIILCIAAAISLILGIAFPNEEEGQTRATGWIEGFSILAAVLIVSTVNAVNNFQKDKQFRILEREKENDNNFVLRGGEICSVRTFDILVGDIIQIQQGDKISADGLMISGKEVKVDQSALTGEPYPVAKDLEKDPFLLSGCIMADGDARMLVLAVGVNSCWGKIQQDLEAEEDPTPLQESLETLAKRIGYLGIICAVIVFIVLSLWWVAVRWIVKTEVFSVENLTDFVQYFIIAVTIVVVAVPEGLPLAVTISLAYSMQKMMLDNNLVRHLKACETMGGVTNICTDKTGTLTENRMTAVEGWIAGEDLKNLKSPTSTNIIVQGIAVNSKATIKPGKTESQYDFLGNKTECALLVLTKKLGANYLTIRDKFPIEKQFNFTSDRKRMTSIINVDGTHRLHCKGGPEIILKLCKSIVNPDGHVVELTDDMRKNILSIVDGYSKQGLRTIAQCFKDFDTSDNSWSDQLPEVVEQDMCFLACYGIEDPLRKEVPEAVKQCHRAGIVVRMVTGDNIETAKKIAAQCGILKPDEIAMDSSDFRSMKPDDYITLKKLRVLARSTPQDKKVLVNRLKTLGEVVAVTGDGTNDAPALKEAHVGLAMGIEGTGVAKTASDIIILDDNFSSIVKAVMWGRNVRENIQKFLQFQLTVNVVALAVAVIAAVTGKGTPLKAIQLLWVNLIMDTLGALALGTEHPTMELLDRHPVGRNYPLISAEMWKGILSQSLYQLGVLFGLLYFGHVLIETELASRVHYTFLFNAFVFCQIFNEINSRRIHQGQYNIFKNLHTSYIFISIIIFEAIVQVILVQFGGDVMMTSPLDAKSWGLSILFGFGSLVWGILFRFVPAPEILCCKVSTSMLEHITEREEKVPLIERDDKV